MTREELQAAVEAARSEWLQLVNRLHKTPEYRAVRKACLKFTTLEAELQALKED